MFENNNIEKLKEIRKNFVFFLEHTSDYIYFKDKQHRFTFTSNAFAQLTGHQNWQELTGKHDFDIFPEEHAKLYFEKEKPVIAEGKVLLRIEEPYYNLEGKLCWATSSKHPVRDEEGNVIGLFGISRDITQIKELEKKLAEQAHFDSLTKLASRSYFLEQAENLLNLAKRNNKALAIFFIDLDGFKSINDQYGHEAGDIVLATIATRLKQRLRDSDVIGRLGGDEFAVVSFNEDEEISLLTLSNVIVELSREPVPFNDDLLKASCSIGIASYPKDGDNIHELMMKADSAMYLAKQDNKTNSVLYRNDY